MAKNHDISHDTAPLSYFNTRPDFHGSLVSRTVAGNRGYFNPLSPNSDQHQISPCNINAYSIPEVMRIKVNFHDISITSPNTFIRKV